MTILDRLMPSPPDALMRAARAFVEDVRPDKIDLGMGIYYDDEGQIPVLHCVEAADSHLRDAAKPWGYLPSEGLAAFRTAVTMLCFGSLPEVARRVVTIQTIGGTGAVRLGAELIHSLGSHTCVSISDPSWPNHEGIFCDVGCAVTRHSYFDPNTGGLDFIAMMKDLSCLAPGSVVVLHGCCHNPTGVDPTPAQWREIGALIASRGHIPFIDLAYQGFGRGLEEDSEPLRSLAVSCPVLFVAVSFSKSFCLYGERVGALCVVTENTKQAKLLDERARRIVRVLNSSPPTHGAALVAEVLSNPVLTKSWHEELDAMRERVEKIRLSLVERLVTGNMPRDFSFIRAQKGLFSYSGLTPEQIDILRTRHGIHAVGDGRLCISALNTKNVDRVADAIRAVCTLN